MHYIINPSIFYWINALNTIRNVSIGSIVVSIMMFIGFMIGCLLNAEYAKDPEYIERHPDDEHIWYFNICKKWMKVSLIIGIIFLLMIVFIPSKSTMIEILIAKTATYENTQWTIETLKEACNYIVEVFNKFK